VPSYKTKRICLVCKNKTCLKTGRPCERIEKLLDKEYTGRLHGEITLSNDKMDEMFYKDYYGDIANTYDRKKHHTEDDSNPGY
jgi:hypothetical protein